MPRRVVGLFNSHYDKRAAQPRERGVQARVLNIEGLFSGRVYQIDKIFSVRNVFVNSSELPWEELNFEHVDEILNKRLKICRNTHLKAIFKFALEFATSMEEPPFPQL